MKAQDLTFGEWKAKDLAREIEAREVFRNGINVATEYKDNDKMEAWRVWFNGGIGRTKIVNLEYDD